MAPPAPPSVSHVFLWKWHDEYSSNVKQDQVLTELRQLYDTETLISLSCGENCMNTLNLPGLESMKDPKKEMGKGFDCGLYCVAKDEESFVKWWSSEDHAKFMAKHPKFASTKINLEWKND